MRTLAKPLLPIFLFFISTVVLACPMCNIHNYMAESVSTARGMQLCVVLDVNKDHLAQVRILESLKGRDRSGEEMRISCYRYEVGDTLLYADSLFMAGVSFRVYPPSARKEIELLISTEGQDTVILDAAQARVALMGISRYSVYLAGQFYQNDFIRYEAELYLLADSMVTALGRDKDQWPPYIGWKMKNLFRVLWQSQTADSETYRKALLEKLLNQMHHKAYDDDTYLQEPYWSIFRTLIAKETGAEWQEYFLEELDAEARSGNQLSGALFVSLLMDVGTLAREGIGEEWLDRISTLDGDIQGYGALHHDQVRRSRWNMSKDSNHLDQALLVAKDSKLRKALKARKEWIEKRRKK